MNFSFFLSFFLFFLSLLLLLEDSLKQISVVMEQTLAWMIVLDRSENVPVKMCYDTTVCHCSFVQTAGIYD